MHPPCVQQYGGIVLVAETYSCLMLASCHETLVITEAPVRRITDAEVSLVTGENFSLRSNHSLHSSIKQALHAHAGNARDWIAFGCW